VEAFPENAGEDRARDIFKDWRVLLLNSRHAESISGNTVLKNMKDILKRRRRKNEGPSDSEGIVSFYSRVPAFGKC
jgi:hypothetical protein